MNRYFTTRQGAIKRLTDLKRRLPRMTAAPMIMTGWRKDGGEVSGVEAVLLNVRTDQILCFRYFDGGQDEVVFVS